MVHEASALGLTHFLLWSTRSCELGAVLGHLRLLVPVHQLRPQSPIPQPVQDFLERVSQVQDWHGDVEIVAPTEATLAKGRCADARRGSQVAWPQRTCSGPTYRGPQLEVISRAQTRRRSKVGPIGGPIENPNDPAAQIVDSTRRFHSQVRFSLSIYE